jgi:NAD(P)-dependent dehydrogenase (short-subunit alcohol dehydrogenase family)
MVGPNLVVDMEVLALTQANQAEMKRARIKRRIFDILSAAAMKARPRCGLAAHCHGKARLVAYCSATIALRTDRPGATACACACASGDLSIYVRMQRHRPAAAL